ncbi:RNA methyltransferase [bacterium]|nr:RNA methyltransferase [bacterium]
MTPSLPSWPLGKSTLHKLTSKKYRQQLGLYLLEGTAAVHDAWKQGGQVLGVVHDARVEERVTEHALVEEMREAGIPLTALNAADYKRLSDQHTPPPVIAVMVAEGSAQPTIPLADPLVLALDQVADPGNVGTLLRAAAFYGVREVWLGEGTAELYNPKVLRAAMAAHLHLKVCQPVDLGQAFKHAQKQGAQVHVAVVDGSTEVVRNQPDTPVILVLGNEPHGIQQEYVEMADRPVAIERIGPVDSLNVAMAGTVFLDRYLSHPTRGA